jgi:hypothetical protein
MALGVSVGSQSSSDVCTETVTRAARLDEGGCRVRPECVRPGAHLLITPNDASGHRDHHGTPRAPRVSQAIYMSNGGLAQAEEAPTPVAYWKKVVAFFAISGLVLFPAFFLLMFGVAQGKPAVKAWFIDAMTIVNLEVRL